MPQNELPPDFIAINALTFYGILIMAIMGFVQAFYMVFLWQRETPRDSPFDRPEAPPGFAWVLMTEQEAAARHAANRCEATQAPRPSWMDDA